MRFIIMLLMMCFFNAVQAQGDLMVKPSEEGYTQMSFAEEIIPDGLSFAVTDAITGQPFTVDIKNNCIGIYDETGTINSISFYSYQYLSRDDNLARIYSYVTLAGEFNVVFALGTQTFTSMFYDGGAFFRIVGIKQPAKE